MLIRYHFAPTTLAGAFARHGGVQLDPLSPVGANHDLVLQARVARYRVDAWRPFAYERRCAIDAWDKQACLVPVEEWPLRRIYHRWNAPRWRERVLDPYPDAVAAVLDEIRTSGPRTTAELTSPGRVEAWEGGWYGARLARNAARALWHTGRLAVRERRGFQHVYDLPERVLPRAVLEAPVPDEEEAVRGLILARHRAAGLLRPGAPAGLWSLPLGAAARRRHIDALAREGALVRVDVDGERLHATPAAVAALDDGRSPSGVRFLAPLDPMLWDREALGRLFGFDYVWEVYTPAQQRAYGWYVLPVLDGSRIVARCEMRAEDGVLRMSGWWWEEGVVHSPARLARLERAAARFARYVGAGAFEADEAVPSAVAEAMRRGTEAAL